ncbi:M-phase phosphoprotein 8 isoform X2 [Synchiropus splendidus]|uniref:M-phase phosphoprotein 8 isoform X2 n=1 Tax=Synchiropus splendidus TaxID=270530 RepID=UPI00237E4FD0|nr:M-phase phosphoprotein 8 isoform X2 [Synchiropus splendidus]
MATETKPEPGESEEEDVYEVERIIDMRDEEGEVLYRVRWKNYCSDDDTWEPEAHLEDCHEVLLAFKKTMSELKAKKEEDKPAEAVPVKPAVKIEAFDADSESDSDKDRPTEAPVKKTKKKKHKEQEIAQLPKEKEKKKKKDKVKEDIKPLPAPETDDDELKPLTPPSPPKEKPRVLSKKHVIDSEEEDDVTVPPKRHKKEKEKDSGKPKKEKKVERKKKKEKKERKPESSEEEVTAPLEEDLSDTPSESPVDETPSVEAVTKSADKSPYDDKSKLKRGKWEVKLHGLKDLTQEKKVKRADSQQKESSLLKLKSLTSKAKEATPHSSDSSDSTTLFKKNKSKAAESSPASSKAPTSSTSSSPSSTGVTPSSNKAKEEAVAKEDASAAKDKGSSPNLFEKFLLNCEAKDRAPRRPPVHQPIAEKSSSSSSSSSSKPTKVIGKTEKVQKPTKESPVHKPEPEKTKHEVTPKASQSHGFSLDSDDMETQESTSKMRPGEDFAERKEEPRRLSSERRMPADEKKKRREGPFMASEDNQDIHDPLESIDKSDKGPSTLNLGMDLNLDWMSLDDFQKHLNGEDELLSGPPLSPSELRDAVKSGDYMAVKLALNSRTEYNLDQEVCTFGGSCLVPSNLDKAAANASGSENEKDIGKLKNISVPAIEPTQENACRAATDSHASEIPDFNNFEKQDGLTQPQEGGSACFSNNPNSSSEGMQKPSEALPAMDACKPDQSPSSEGSDSNKVAGDVIQTQLDGTSKAAAEGLAKPEHKKRMTERREPVRSSERTCKKVLPSAEILMEEWLEEKPTHAKHFCIYCRLAVSHISKHLEKKHAEETDVAHAIHFPKGSKVRQTLLDQICKKGDYEYGHFLKKGRWDTVSSRQSYVGASNRDFLPCQHCFTFHRNADLWSHEQSCKSRTEAVPPSDKASGSGSSSLSEFLTDSCREIIHVMHQDELCQHIKNDPLICKFGSAQSVKCDHNKSQFPHIAQTMRDLARFMLAVNHVDQSVQYLHEICLQSKFDLAVEGAKRACAFAPSDALKTPPFITTLGHSLKRAAEIAFGESRMTEDSETENEVKGFIQLLDTKWDECFAPSVGASPSTDEVEKFNEDESTVTEDLMKLHRFISAEENGARLELRERPSTSIWKRLSEATLADVCLFNRGRVGNIGRMLLHTYAHKRNTGTCLLTADQIRKNTKLELELCGGFTRLELEGQYGRNVTVLLTEKMVFLIDLLINYREDASVSKSNTYLFARTEGPSFIRGLDCIRKTAVESGVKNPEALLSPSLREQIACCWQLLSLRESELDQIGKLLGRSGEDFFRLTDNPSQVEQVSKELLQMDRTLPQFSGTLKDGTVLKTPVKRRPWSEREQAAVKRYLCDFITKMKVPGKKECNACIAGEPDLVGRTWTDVKNFVHNTLQTMRRRNKQGKRCQWNVTDHVSSCWGAGRHPQVAHQEGREGQRTPEERHYSTNARSRKEFFDNSGHPARGWVICKCSNSEWGDGTDEGSGIILFIFHANFLNDITARLCGPCSVHAVVLNDKFQLPIFLDSHFIYSFSPVIGINKLFIRFADAPTAKVKLLICAYRVQLQ